MSSAVPDFIRVITIVQGHPNPAGNNFGHALADAYARGAAAAGFDVRRIEVARLDFPLLRTKEEHESGSLPAGLQQASTDLFTANHIVFFFPLWLGAMPALLKGFLEQIARPPDPKDPMSFMKLFKGKTCRIVVTMGMPVPLFRFYFGAHGLKSFEQSVLRFAGMGSIRESLIGMVEGNPRQRETWLKSMETLGSKGV